MSPNGGTSAPPISGQSGKTSAASTDVTLLPKRSSAYAATAVKTASSVKRWLAPRPGLGAGWRRHGRAVGAEPNRLLAERGLEADEGDRADRGHEQARPVPVVEEGKD